MGNVPREVYHVVWKIRVYVLTTEIHRGRISQEGVDDLLAEVMVLLRILYTYREHVLLVGFVSAKRPLDAVTLRLFV